MKTVLMSELQIGDVFCHEMKLNGREAFIVESITDKAIMAKSRKDGKLVKKTKSGNVIFLRRVS